MNTSIRKDFTLKIAFLTAVLVMAGGCATTGSLSDASSRLDRSAEALYDDVRDDSDLRGEAESFASAADNFNDEVRDGATRDELRREFDDVAERYHELRDEYGDERDSSTRSRTAFSEVTRAYLDLERELQYKRVADSRD
jgi:hypothetical protein